MRILVDSHVALWWLEDKAALGPQCRQLVGRADEVYFSAVTPSVLGIKRQLGKLTMPDGMGDALKTSGFLQLPISVDHAERAPKLPSHHRDPFDRMLVAQAQIEALALVTADRALLPYDVEVIDARL